MFVAPPEKEVEWTDSGLEGAFRFLTRVWRIVTHVAPVVRGASAPDKVSLSAADRAMRRKTHDTIRRVTQDIDPRMHLNTAISALMEHVNELYLYAERHGVRPSGAPHETAPVVEDPGVRAVLGEAVDALVRLISPFSPHMAEELWEMLGHNRGLTAAGWPAFDEDAAREEAIEVPVQVNGKVRGRITVPADATDEDIEAAALSSPQIQANIEGRQVVKTIVARGRLVSLVVR
jgi:leucyl-tRNA synthetase